MALFYLLRASKLPFLCRNMQEAFGNCQFVAAICRKLLATANSLPQFAGSFWQLPILCRNLQEAFGSCQFFAAICRKLLATANSLPQFAGSFWQLPIRCRNLQEAFGNCQFVAAICRKLLTAFRAFTPLFCFYAERSPRGTSRNHDIHGLCMRWRGKGWRTPDGWRWPAGRSRTPVRASFG